MKMVRRHTSALLRSILWTIILYVSVTFVLRGFYELQSNHIKQNKVENKYNHLDYIHNILHYLDTNRNKPPQGNSSLEATNEDITIQTKFPPAKSILDLINENINVEDKENLGNIGIYLSPNKKAPFQLMDSWNKQSKDFIYNRYQNYCRTLGKENVCPCLTEEHGNFGEFTAFCII